MQQLIGRVTGTRFHPTVEFQFTFGQALPHGGSAVSWVKSLHGSRAGQQAGHWIVNATHVHPDNVFIPKGITLDYSEAPAEARETQRLEPLWRPFVTYSASTPDHVFVYPRFAGYERTLEVLGPGSSWDKTHRRFIARVTDLVDGCGNIKRGLVNAEHAQIRAQQLLTPPPIPESVREAGRKLASHNGVDRRKDQHLGSEARTLISVVSAHTGTIPEWFGLDLYPYQECGVYSAVAGHRFIADPPGLGKTRQALGAAAVLGAQRVLIICPPLVSVNWAREASKGLSAGFKTQPARGKGKGGVLDPEGTVIIRAGRKTPPLPEHGVVVAPHSLIKSRKELWSMLIEWKPEAIIVDEVHQLRNWVSVGGLALRRLAGATNAPVFALTGTPLLAEATEIPNQLAISGHLDYVFGGASKFLDTYTAETKYDRETITETLPDLANKLDSNVWVRRNKNEVLWQLPAKTRAIQYVEIDPKLFQQAHKKLYGRLNKWLNELPYEPSDEQVVEYAKENIGLLSPLRLASGLSKVPVAVATVIDAVSQSPANSAGLYDDPLVVWAHHSEVLEALAQAMTDTNVPYKVISGSTSSDDRAQIADDFQNGKLAVVICSIIAAGVGITLTRGNRAIYVETDWTPALVTQSEDRLHRIGQERPVLCTTLIAPDTLDPHIRKVLHRKSLILDQVLAGGDNAPSQADHYVDQHGVRWEDEADMQVDVISDQYEILVRIVNDLKKSRRKS